MYRRLAGCEAEANAGILTTIWLLFGPPGAGTSRLARRLITLPPAMTLAEATEATRIHRVAGLTGDRTALVPARRLRAPRHTIADVGLIGGGHVPMPGEVPRAHYGVRFLGREPTRCPSGGV